MENAEKALIAEARALSPTLKERAELYGDNPEAERDVVAARLLDGLADTLESVAKERDALRFVLQEFLGMANAADYSEMDEAEQFKVAQSWLAKYDERRKATADRDALLKFLHSLKDGVLHTYAEPDHWEDDIFTMAPMQKDGGFDARAAVNLINEQLRKYNGDTK